MCPLSLTVNLVHAVPWDAWSIMHPLRHWYAVSANVPLKPVSHSRVKTSTESLSYAFYKEGNELATECLDEHCDFLGHGIAGFINIFSPQRIVIGGGLSEAGDFYIRKVSEKAHRYAIADCAVNTQIMAASLGNKAGSIGSRVTGLLIKHKIV